MIGGKFHSTSLRELLLRTDWRDSLRGLLSMLDKQSQPWVIILDELPLFVMTLLRQDRARAESFLSQLRAFRQEFKNVRWLMTGSVGLDIITRREKLGGTINDIEPFDLKPLSSDAALRLVRDLVAAGKCPTPFEIEEAEFAHLVRRLAWLSPYYVEKLALVMRPTGAGLGNGVKQATIEDVNRAFDALLDRGQRTNFSAWTEHIDKNFDGSERDRLRLILNALAKNEAGELVGTLLSMVGRRDAKVTEGQIRDALDMLESDGYIEVADGRYRFRSGLVRLWWMRWETHGE